MSETPGIEALVAGFADANPEFSPVPIWWWSGEPLELDRMCWQIDQLVAQGVYNAVVLNLAPTGPLYGALSDEPHMATEEWWRIWEDICAHSEKVGMRLWFYDQVGFSGANLQGRVVVANPEFVGQSLFRESVRVAEHGEVEVPEAGIPLAAMALPLGDDDSVKGPPEPLVLNGRRASWNGAGRALVMAVYALRRGFDYHSPEACRALMDIVHHQFEARLGRFFGTAIVGSFQDELPSLPTWSSRFASTFEQRTGYSIIEHLAALWEDYGPESARIRLDYQRVRASLAEDALFKPIFDWHEKHGLQIGVDQQSPSRAGEPLSTVDQYADYMRTHRWYSAPGSDHWGDAKIHSSLAHSYGRSRTWIESFHSSGWGGTLEETFDWLQPWLLAGANLYNPHAVYYSTRGGQWEWAAPSTCWRQPYWQHYKVFADAVSRLCWLATRGEHVCDIAVLFPSATVQSDLFIDGAGPRARAANDSYQALLGSMTWFNAKSGTMNRLLRDFDVLDDDTIASARIEDGALVTRAERYRAMILPAAAVLETATAEKLVALVEAGGCLIFVGPPPDRSDSDAGETAVERLLALVAEGTIATLSATDDLDLKLRAALERIPVTVETSSPMLRRREGRVEIALVTAAPTGSATAPEMLPWCEFSYDSGHLSWSRYHEELRKTGYDFDPTRNRSTTRLRIFGPVGTALQFDPGTGRAHPLAVSRADGVAEVEVDFSRSPLAAVVWTTSDEFTETAAPIPLAHRSLRLDGAWEAHLVPTIDNRHGDFLLPAGRDPLPVQAWKLGHLADDAAEPRTIWADGPHWDMVPVTEGVQAWSFGPTDPSRLPPPLATASGSLEGEGWAPVRYSLSRGINVDPQHDKTLGPKGRIPEPFIRIGHAKAREACRFRTTLPVGADRRLTLAVGANGPKRVWWNGEELRPDAGGYLYLEDVDAKAGRNLIEIEVTATEDGDIEAYWALTTDRAAFIRPEWLEPSDGWKPGTIVTIVRDLTLVGHETVVAQFGSMGVARLMINGISIALHGAFEPYAARRHARIARYDLTPHLRPGKNRIECRLEDAGTPISFYLDAVATSPDGSETILVSDKSWSASRDGREVSLVMQPTFRYDPRFYMLRPRPHPLPRTGWLNPNQPLAGVLDIQPDPYPARRPPAQWFSIALPPGATRAHLPIAGVSLSAFIGGERLPIDGQSVTLPAGPAGRRLLIRVAPSDGRTSGGLWDGPVTFDCTDGPIALGPWDQQGLAFYSGGVAYSTHIDLNSDTNFTLLDLGRVRGTAEVRVNGRSAGTRIWSPYVFDMRGLLVGGRNEISVTVFNTIAPYLAGSSASGEVYAGQLLSGLMGPVELR